MLNGEKVILPETEALNLVLFHMRILSISLYWKALVQQGLNLTFFAITEKGDADKISVSMQERGVVPRIESEDAGLGKRISLTYPETDETYYVLTHNARTRQRTLDSGCLEDALSNRLSNGDHTYDELRETFSGSFKTKKR